MILDIDPKVDYAFKYLLGRDATRPILINVIDSVLNPAPGHRIQDLELLDPFNPKETAEDKLSILDIKARDHSGRQFNIEMQLRALQSFPQRIVYYGTRLHQQQLHEGHDYGELKPTICISFLNYTLFPNEAAEYHLRFRLLEERKHFPLTDSLEFHLLELPKFTKPADQLVSDLDVWLYFLRHAATMDTDALPAALQQHPLVPRAVEELKMITQSDIERERYEARRKAQLDHNTYLREQREARERELEVARDQARLEGHLEGQKEGQKEGEKMGQAKGEKIGMIHAFERVLHLPQTPTEQLMRLTLDELARLASDLEARLMKQR